MEIGIVCVCVFWIMWVGKAGIQRVWTSRAVIIIYSQFPLVIIINPFCYHPCMWMTQRDAPRQFILVELFLNYGRRECYFSSFLCFL